MINEDYINMGKTMQVNIFREGVRSWLLLVANWIAALVGLQVISIEQELVQDGCRQIPNGHQSFDPALDELVQDGCRQIPGGHQSFDPALADYFKSLKMRNGKHINLAVSYSVVAKWNSSNKRRGQSEWTYGSDRHYAANYTAVDRKTWGQHMDELVTLGLVAVSQIKGNPAYKALPYQILNDQLHFVHAPDYGHDAQKVARDAQGYGHDAPPITEGLDKELSGNGINLKPAAAPRTDAGAAGIDIPQSLEKSLSKNPIPAVTIDAVVGDDPRGILSQPASPSPSVPPVSPAQVDWLGEEDCPDDPPADLKLFFNGCRPAELEMMIQQYGVDRIYAVIAEVRTQTDVKSPPGLVINKLRSGAQAAWKWPEKLITEQDGKDYITGEYARFIKH